MHPPGSTPNVYSIASYLHIDINHIKSPKEECCSNNPIPFSIRSRPVSRNTFNRQKGIIALLLLQGKLDQRHVKHTYSGSYSWPRKRSLQAVRFCRQQCVCNGPFIFSTSRSLKPSHHLDWQCRRRYRICRANNHRQHQRNHLRYSHYHGRLL